MLSMVMMAMTARAVMSLFAISEDNKLYALAYLISEPIIVPVRFLLYRLNLFQSTPLDMSFMITYLLLWIIDGALA